MEHITIYVAVVQFPVVNTVGYFPINLYASRYNTVSKRLITWSSCVFSHRNIPVLYLNAPMKALRYILEQSRV